METAADASAAEIALILVILDAQCYVASYGQPYAGLATSRPTGPYSFDVIIKPDLSQIIRPGTAAGREYRAELMRRAEDTLEALETAGWHLMSYPRMEFSGDVRPFMQTLAGKVMELSSQGGIELKMRFEVQRGRP